MASSVKDRAISDDDLLVNLRLNLSSNSKIAADRIEELLAENARLKSELTELRSK